METYVCGLCSGLDKGGITIVDKVTIALALVSIAVAAWSAWLARQTQKRNETSIWYNYWINKKLDLFNSNRANFPKSHTLDKVQLQIAEEMLAIQKKFESEFPDPSK